MAHLDLETWREQDKREYKSEVIDPGVDYTGPCLDKLSKKKLAQMHASVRKMNYKEAKEYVHCLHIIIITPASVHGIHRCTQAPDNCCEVDSNWLNHFWSRHYKAKLDEGATNLGESVPNP